MAGDEILFLFYFFYSTVSKREREQDREKRGKLRNLFSGSVCWQAPSWQHQLLSTAGATLAPSSINNTSSIRNTSSSNNNLKTHKQKKFAAFNMKQQKNGIFLELKCKARKK
jgi:hypothetical protein